MPDFCVERVWDNGDMTDCGLPVVEVVKGRPLCGRHIPKPKTAKPKRIKDVSWNPTTEEAEEYLRAHGVDPKDVVNGFIEQLLKERGELQSQLAQVTQDRDDLLNRSHQTVLFECGCMFKQEGLEAEPMLIVHCPTKEQQP